MTCHFGAVSNYKVSNKHGLTTARQDPEVGGRHGFQVGRPGQNLRKDSRSRYSGESSRFFGFRFASFEIVLAAGHVSNPHTLTIFHLRNVQCITFTYVNVNKAKKNSKE